MKKILIVSNIVLLLIVIILLTKGSYWNRSYNYNDNPKYKPETEKFMLFTKQADIVMLGNSITAGIDWNELLGRKDIVNRGINGDITEGMLNRMNSVLKVKPKICFFMGGINDLSRRVSPENIVENIKKIVSTLLENDIKPVLQSIIYTEKSFYDYEHNNKYVTIINKELKKFAEGKGVLYLDMNKDLSEKGLLKAEYTPDGLHLNAEGYIVWGRVVKEIIDNEEF